MKQSRIRIALTTFLWIMALPVTMVFAGELNSQETRLIQSIQKTYEYEGKTYQVNSQYMDMLREYLMQDDVDLTTAEVDSIIPQVMGNVSTGVLDGYLVEIPEKGTETPTQEVTATPTPTKIPISKPTQIPTASPIQGTNDVPTTITPNQGLTVTEVPVINHTGTNSGPGNGVGMTDIDFSENGKAVATNDIENNEGDYETSKDKVQESLNSNEIQKTNENQKIRVSVQTTIIIGGMVVIIFFIALILAYRVRKIKR